ncbi:hypothetical protein KFE25_010878 [Diacronema lutheri]|uniref:Fe2OG dioxygenase domain-containing protein n=2 Tax=Diacronema lutheri TaxID=2081491 RepID=A0A8J6CAU2_DIALT|nr:hypothetical protein KFE25_010878 [Diacronema lutheri]
MVLSPSEIAARQRDERVDYEWSIDDARLVGTGGADARTDARAARFALHVVRDVLDEQAEAALVRSINAGGEWTPSQSGRRKQDFGPKVGFKSRRLSAAHFGGFPPYARALFERVCEACAGLDGFEAAEMAVLEYEESRGACIDYHIDDAWVWGDRIVIVSLLAPCSMRFRRGGCVVRVQLPARSALVISGEARAFWEHAILRSELRTTRLSVTFRELAPQLHGDRQHARAVRRLGELALRRRAPATSAHRVCGGWRRVPAAWRWAHAGGGRSAVVGLCVALTCISVATALAKRRGAC